MFESRHLTDNLGGDVVVAGGKAGPPVTVTALSAFGIPLEQWVFVATLIYVVLQIALLVYKFARDLRGKGGRDG